PIPPPNTVVASQPDQGGGLVDQLTPSGPAPHHGHASQGQNVALGSLRGWADVTTTPWTLAGTVSGTDNGSANSGDSSGAQGVLPGASVANAAVIPAGFAVASTLETSSPAAVATVPLPDVLQALDDVLATWTSPYQPGSILSVDSTGDASSNSSAS